MKYHQLLNSYGGNISMIPPFNMYEMTKVDQSDPYFETTLYKKYNVGTNKLNPLPEIERAISRLAKVMTANGSIKGFGGYGFSENGDFYCDYYDGSVEDYNAQAAKAVGSDDFSLHRHTVMCIKTSVDGTCKELYGTCVDEYGLQTQYLLADRGKKDSIRKTGSAGIYALLCYMIASYERGDLPNSAEIMEPVRQHYKDVLKALDDSNFPLLYKAGLALDSDIYCLLQYPEVLRVSLTMPDASLPFEPKDFDYPDTQAMVDVNHIPELKDIVGSSAFFNGTAAEKSGISIEVKPKSVTVADLVKSRKYNLGVILSEEEKELIPKGFDNFSCEEIILDTANEIKESRFDPRPCRNILWTGESGTGKTTSAMMLAAVLGLPYYSMNLSSDKMSSDILTSCLPNNKKASEKDIEDVLSSFPSEFEIQMDPVAAFEKLSGIRKEDVTEAEIQHFEAKMLYNAVNNASDFMYVDSPFVSAYRKGGIIELQECNSAKAQILKSLNEALDDTATIHLPTGEVVHRNENCYVIVTANIGQGYRGIEDFSNDFIARMDQHDRFELPSENELIERVVDRSGYENRENIKKMIKVMKAIQKVLLEIRGDYGSCSPRALYSWARKTKNCGKPYYAGLKTIVGLATQDPEEEVELIAQLELYFKKSDKA